MSAYQTVVVGTDGSATSLRAVERASGVAAQSHSKLIIATAYPWLSTKRKTSAILREAADRAEAAGATNTEARRIPDAPVEALVDLAADVEADLLVVGDVELSAILGRLFSVPGNVNYKATTDVPIVHTAS